MSDSIVTFPDATSARSSNSLRSVRVAEGMSKAGLARLANLSERTIRIVENGERRSREETLHQILNAINRNPQRVRNDPYAFDEVFPPHQDSLF